MRTAELTGASQKGETLLSTTIHFDRGTENEK